MEYCVAMIAAAGNESGIEVWAAGAMTAAAQQDTQGGQWAPSADLSPPGLLSPPAEGAALCTSWVGTAEWSCAEACPSSWCPNSMHRPAATAAPPWMGTASAMASTRRRRSNFLGICAHCTVSVWTAAAQPGSASRLISRTKPPRLQRTKPPVASRRNIASMIPGQIEPMVQHRPLRRACSLTWTPCPLS